MPRYFEQPDLHAEVQAQAVDLVDRIGPLLTMLAETPRTVAWSDLARATEHLQAWYQVAFVSPDAHPEPGRTREEADVIGAMLDHVAHAADVRAGDTRTLSFADKASCAAYAATVAEHLRQCLISLGRRAPKPGDATRTMTEDTADDELQRDLDGAIRAYRALARATREAQQ